jgi:glucuronokinase
MGEQLAPQGAATACTPHDALRVGVVLLAAGYGTRLVRDMRDTPAFAHLADTPKPLLPVGGRVLLDHWMEALEALAPRAKLESVVVVSNGAHYQRYRDWAAARGDRLQRQAVAQPQPSSGLLAVAVDEDHNDESKSDRPGEDDTGGCSLENTENSAASGMMIPITVVSDGSSSNDTRLGAVADIEIGLDALAHSAPVSRDGTPTAPPSVAIVIAGDTLLPGLDMAQRLAEFEKSAADIGVFAYTLQDVADCVRRGMLEIQTAPDGSSKITRLVEKPTVENCPSCVATAPVYIMRRDAFHTVSDFLAHSREAGVGLERRDAPGFWLGWTIPRKHCVALTTDKRVDIGGLGHYRDALVDYASHPSATRRMDIEPAVGRALPRVGLLGNPSDGYSGKCIAVAIESEGYAEVVATPTNGLFAVVANEAHEMPGHFRSILSCSEFISDSGIHFGAKQLVMAGVSVFTTAYMEWERRNSRNGDSHVTANNSSESALKQNCLLSYSTTIPVRIGLSGSSALVLATVRALSRFYGTSLNEMDPAEASWPRRVLDGETNLLGIAAGLQDRVAQVYQGCMYMDLADPDAPILERLDVERLPEIWLAYAKGMKVGEHSGKVHSNLRKRFQEGDKDLLSNMKSLANVAEEGRAALLSGGSLAALPSLVRQNWDIRLALFGGPSGIADENLRLVKCAHSVGFASKLTGSGGAVLCVPDPLRSLSEEEIQDASRTFDSAGFVFRKLRFSRPSNELKL